MVLISLLIFSFLPLFIWTLGAQSSAPMQVSASVSISCWMKVLWWLFKILISLTTGQGQFRPPLLYCLGSQLGSSLCIPGNFSKVRFLVSPAMVPSIKISLSLLSYLSFLLLNYSIPSSSPHPFLSPLLFPFHHPFYPHPHAPNFVRWSCLFPLSRWIYICFSYGSPYYLASPG